MDWERQSLEWSDDHFDFFKYQKSGTRYTTILSKIGTDQEVSEQRLLANSDWGRWLAEASFLQSKERQPGICLIMCSRGTPVFEGATAPLYDLPFETQILHKINQRFFIHPTITRTINRLIPYVSVQVILGSELNEPIITSTARTTGSLPNDLAISCTYLARSNLNLAVVYGCDEAQIQAIKKRIKGHQLSDNHPLLFPGILAELERLRLSKIVDRQLSNFTLRAYGDSERGLSLDIDRQQLTGFLQMCYESRDLINHIKATRAQIIKVATEVPRLESAPWADGPNSLAMAQAGERIRVRLEEILCELEDKIHECELIIDNMSLTMQTAWNHFAREDNKINISLARTSTGLSSDMQKDSSQMRSIALLTMVFVPMTTLASIFSSNLFAWDPDLDKTTISGYLWVFIIMAVGLTTVTVVLWYLTTRRAGRKGWNQRQSNDIELALHRTL